MNNMRNKILSLLVLLLTAASGAWAEETPLVTIQASENSTFTSGSKTFNDIATVTITGNGYIDVSGWASCMLTVTPADGVTITSVKFYGSVNGDVVEDTSSPFEAENKYDSNVSREVTIVNGTKAFDYGVTKIEVFGTAEPPLAVEWNPATKTGNFVMPAYDVEIAPIYAPTAMFATDGNLVLTPTAIEGIYAESTDAIVKAGTVAMIGETENPQGIVMYAVTSTNQATAPELSAFSATLPTAKDITIGSEVLVWYYIKGADTPQGQTATAENTFNDSEICAEPIKVTVLNNKFDINFNAANANTIEAGKATVTVGGTAATVTEGKLEGVKMGSEVKVTAKEGYKFRKAEGKKKTSIVPVTAITLNKTETSIKVGATETLSVTSVLPEEATDKTYTWKTSDETKATVDQDGKVTAVAEGTVTIYAEANDGSGVKGNCTVTVTPAPVPVTVTWNNNDITGTGNSFTKGGVTLTAGQIDYKDKDISLDGTFTTTLGNFTKIEVTTAWFSASGTGWSSGTGITPKTGTWTGNASSVSFSGNIWGQGEGNTKFVFTIEPKN